MPKTPTTTMAEQITLCAENPNHRPPAAVVEIAREVLARATPRGKVTDAQLQEATDAVKFAEVELSAAIQARHALIRRALNQPQANGAHIGRQTGLTRAAVAKVGGRRG